MKKWNHWIASTGFIFLSFTQSLLASEIGQEAEIYYSFKVVMLGDSSVGKTSILYKAKYGNFEVHPFSTIGVASSIFEFPIEDHTIQLSVMDTAGQERFHAMSASFSRDAAAVVLVFDVAKKQTFDNIRKWKKQIEVILGHDNPPLYFLIGNKTDLQTTRQVEDDDAIKLMSEHGFSKYYAHSAKLDKMDAFFRELAQEIYTTHLDSLCHFKMTRKKKVGVILTPQPQPIKTTCCPI